MLTEPLGFNFIFNLTERLELNITLYRNGMTKNRELRLLNFKLKKL
jgi:hypothetical protein